MSKLIPFGLGIAFTFGMALDSPGPGGDIATCMCVLGLLILSTGHIKDCYKKRTYRSGNSYKFK